MGFWTRIEQISKHILDNEMQVSHCQRKCFQGRKGGGETE